MAIERAVRDRKRLMVQTVTYRGQTIERAAFDAKDFVRAVLLARRSKTPPRDLSQFLDRYDASYRD